MVCELGRQEGSLQKLEKNKLHFAHMLQNSNSIFCRFLGLEISDEAQTKFAYLN